MAMPAGAEAEPFSSEYAAYKQMPSSSRRNATLDTVIGQVESLGGSINDLVLHVNADVQEIARIGGETFGSFGDRFARGKEDVHHIATTARDTTASFPINALVLLLVAALVCLTVLLANLIVIGIEKIIRLSRIASGHAVKSRRLQEQYATLPP